uniref:DP2 n=1 Tax=Arundo donax TaxID=35708 RepID=A0A0A8YV80_ARUDO
MFLASRRYKMYHNQPSYLPHMNLGHGELGTEVFLWNMKLQTDGLSKFFVRITMIVRSPSSITNIERLIHVDFDSRIEMLSH